MGDRIAQYKSLAIYDCFDASFLIICQQHPTLLLYICSSGCRRISVILDFNV